MLFLVFIIPHSPLGRVAQSGGDLALKSEALGSIPGLASVSLSADSRGAAVSDWRKYVYVHEVPVNH